MFMNENIRGNYINKISNFVLFLWDMNELTFFIIVIIIYYGVMTSLSKKKHKRQILLKKSPQRILIMI